jgi:predicted PurR-regulated permease PerM
MTLPVTPPESPPWSITARWIAVIAGAIGLIWLLVAALPLVEALAIAALLAYLLDPFVKMLMRRSRLNRTLAVMVVYTILLIIVASLPATLGALAFGQFQNFRINLSEAIREIQTWASQPILILGFRLSPQSLVDNVNQAIGRALTVLPGGSLGVLSGITTNLLWGLVIVISLYYFLKDGPKIKPWVVNLLPPAYRPDGTRLLNEIDEVWRVFLRVQILIFFILAVLLAIGSFVVVLLYQAGLIPFSWIGLIVVLIIVYALIQQVDNLWLRPLWMGQRLRLHPGVVFVGLVGALALSGFLGAIIVVPLIASVKVISSYVHCKLIGLQPWSSVEEPPDENLPVAEISSSDESGSERSEKEQ